MATGIFAILAENKSAHAALDARVTKLEEEVASATDLSTLTGEVAQVKTELANLQTVVGQPDAPAT